ncbi:EpsG family protein [Bacillus salipaludis]|uniref:EpsG family protein n=1 Tax=Bacillus salipaludis TaxID=2547811 RepID=UPI003D229D23
MDSKMKIKTKKRILFALIVVLTIFLGFRDIGLDLEPYRLMFNNLNVTSFKELISINLFSDKLEPFFVFLISMLKEFGLGFNWFLLISGGIPLLLIFRLIKEREEKEIFTVFLFFLLLQFFRGPVTIIRGFFAATIYLSALSSLSKNSNLKFWFKSIFSVFFHYSSIVILFIRPFLSVKWTKSKYFISFAFVTIVGYLVKLLIMSLSIQDFLTFNNPIIWKLGYYLIYYNTQGYQYTGIVHRILLSIMSYFPLIFNVIFIILGLNKSKLIDKDNFIRLLLNSQIIGSLVAVFFIVLNASTLGLRVNFLLSVGNFILMKDIIFIYYKNSKRMLFTFTVFSLIFYNFVIILYFAGIHDPNSPFYLSY